MSTTIAVALITAVSTVTGVTVSGLVAFLVGRTQSITQVTIAREQLLEQRLIDRRQIKRDTYLQFINEISTAERAKDAVVTMSPKDYDRGEYVKLVRSALSDIQHAYDLVSLEGPQDVSGCALKLWMNLAKSFITLTNQISSSENFATAVRIYNETTEESTVERIRLKREFTNLVQKELDEALNVTPLRNSQTRSPQRLSSQG